MFTLSFHRSADVTTQQQVTVSCPKYMITANGTNLNVSIYRNLNDAEHADIFFIGRIEDEGCEDEGAIRTNPNYQSVFVTNETGKTIDSRYAPRPRAQESSDRFVDWVNKQCAPQKV